MEKQKELDYIAEKEALITSVSDNIWEVAETAFEEYKSVEYLCDALESEGFEVERNVGDIETAFTGRYGKGYPINFMASVPMQRQIHMMVEVP